MAFNKTMAAAFKPAHVNGLKAHERHVLLELCNGASMRGGRLFPSHETIAAACGVSRATVVRAVARLEVLGWITRDRRRRKNGTRSTDLYYVQIPGGAAAPDLVLPLMAVVPKAAHNVAVCNTVKVAGSNIGPRSQSCREQQQTPIKESKPTSALSAVTAQPVDKRSDHDPEVAAGLTSLLEQMKAKASEAEPKRARRTLERRAG